MTPAVRTTNKSPNPWSKIISGGTRESAQLNIAAKGFCVKATLVRRYPEVSTVDLPDTYRRFPSINLFKVGVGKYKPSAWKSNCSWVYFSSPK
jgi:hypothetical protein